MGCNAKKINKQTNNETKRMQELGKKLEQTPVETVK
jgi:hypothetical protein